MKRPVANIVIVRRLRGVTLVELLISLALGLAVLVGLSAVYVAAKQSFRFQETGGRMQEDAMFAMETISRELRMAGFAGCRGVEKINESGTDIYYPNLSLTDGKPGGIAGPNPLAIVEPLVTEVILKPLSPSNFIRGFDGVPSTMFTTAPVSSATDSLFFSGGSSKAVSLTAPMAAADKLTIATGSAGFLDASKVYNLIVSNCKQSTLFAGQVTDGGTRITHDASTNSASTISPNSGATGLNIGPPYSFPTTPFNSVVTYDVDSLVMPLEWSFYYVATRTGAATPSLYRVAYDGNARGAAEELVSNVESMRLHYGENTMGNTFPAPSVPCVLATTPSGCEPTKQADEWRTSAAAVTNWSRVVAVRIGLMMVSEDNAANRDVVTADPPLLGASYAGPAGKSATRLRKEFSTTVVLRNRIAPR
jgi:type IV pilus assembly protein PilW